MVKMRVFVALTGYILKRRQQVVKSLSVSQCLVFGKTKYIISLYMYFFDVVSCFFRNERESASVPDVVLNQKKPLSLFISASKTDKIKSQAVDLLLIAMG